MPIGGGVFFDAAPWLGVQYQLGNGWFQAVFSPNPEAWWFVDIPAPSPTPTAYVGKSTLGDVINEAALLLNDVSLQKFSLLILTGFAKKAFLELEIELINYGLPIALQIDTPQTIPAGQTFYTLPADMFRPIKMEERPAGSDSSVLFSPMEEKSFEPNVTVTESLKFWVWRQEGIKFVGANTSREVRLYYYNLFRDLAVVTDAIPVTLAKGFLAARTAALAAMYIGENTTRAAALQDDAQSQLDKLVNLTIRGRQALPGRRRPYRAYKIRTGI